MSDKTPESAEPKELPEGEVAAAADAAESLAETSAKAESEPVELDLQLDEPAVGIQRKTAKAPVRRKDIDPEADDEVIADLEADLPADKGEQGDKAAKSPVKKGTATRKRDDSKHEVHDPYGPTNPINFTKQSAAELQKVVWPTWVQLLAYFAAVLVFVLFFIVLVGLLDMLFGWGLLSLFGESR